MIPAWWRSKHEAHKLAGTLTPRPPKRQDPHYAANREARLDVLWGYHRADRRVSADSPGVDRYLMDTGGTPLDWVLAWEAVEERESR